MLLTPMQERLLELRTQAQAIISAEFYLTPSTFEELVVRQFVFRWNMLNFSEPFFVPASTLFNGGYCSNEFRQREFQLEDDVLWVAKAPSLGVWAEGTKPKPDLQPEV